MKEHTLYLMRIMSKLNWQRIGNGVAFVPTRLEEMTSTATLTTLMREQIDFYDRMTVILLVGLPPGMLKEKVATIKNMITDKTEEQTLEEWIQGLGAHQIETTKTQVGLTFITITKTLDETAKDMIDTKLPTIVQECNLTTMEAFPAGPCRTGTRRGTVSKHSTEVLEAAAKLKR